MIKQGGQNVAFLFNKPSYIQCGTCRHLSKSCYKQSLEPAIGLLHDGTCSGYRWSFIKWIKGFHTRNVWSNMFNKIKW